jgi:hypothetical protein
MSADTSVRDACEEDNQALVELARACTMEGEISLRIDRSPDFFALDRVAGEPWRVGVARDGAGQVVGSIAVALRRAHLHAQPRWVGYVGDLKVHPGHRGPRLAAADRLIRFALETGRALGGDDLPGLFTILAGNRPMEHRIPGVRGLPSFGYLATLRVFSLPLLWGPRPPRPDLELVPARLEDIGEMIALWQRLAPRLQFSEVHDEDSFVRWLERAPGLELSSYRLARRRDGRLEGFLGLWDQRSVKQLRVVGYSRRLAVLRLAFNAVARPAGAAPLPPAGGELGCVTAVHVCTPLADPPVLRRLVLGAVAELRGRGLSLLHLGCDERDPRTAALRGLLAPSTRVHAYVSTTSGSYAGPRLDDRPLHHEIALT